jgi:flagellar motility protein MotE (MotC chaperone)
MQMVTTGWLGEEPEETRPVGFADFILKNRKPAAEGHTLGQVFARAAQARDREPEREDPDDRLAALVTRGYSPGMISQLSQQLADTQAEIQAEREKIDKGARRAARIHQAHQAGRLDAFAVMRAMDFDEGDEDRVRLLERRAEGLRAQIADAQAVVSPPERRAPDPLEAASRHAHQVFAEVTRQRFAEAQAGRPEPRPFASVSRGAGRSTEHTGPDCSVCAEARRRDAARDRADYAAVYGEAVR